MNHNIRMQLISNIACMNQSKYSKFETKSNQVFFPVKIPFPFFKINRKTRNVLVEIILFFDFMKLKTNKKYF